MSGPTRQRPAWALHRLGLAWALVALGLLRAVPAGAQESALSLNFLGIREETSDGRARGLGVLGVGLGDSLTAASLNPGSFALLKRMSLTVVGTASVHTANDGTIEHDRSDATFPHLRAALPLPGDFVFSIGFVGLRNYRSEFVLPAESVGPYGYRDAFKREGSLYEVPVGIARSVHDRVHLGLSLDFLLGTVNDAWTTSGDSLLSLRTRRRDGMNGTTVTLGVVADAARWLRLGVAWSPAVDLDVETTTTIEDGRVGGTTTALRTDVTRSTARYPATFRGGATARLGRRALVTADYLHRDWSDWNGRLYGADATTTEWRLGGGFEVRPHRSARWNRLTYRVGASHGTWAHQLGGNDISETTIHFGPGWGLVGGYGRLDAAIEYTQIGDLGKNGYEESRWSFVLSVSGQETWRRKSPRGE